MPIINTARTIFFIFALLFCGCTKEKGSPQPQDYARFSQEYYLRAIDSYKKLISSGANRDQLHLELGRLYFSHGDFTQAALEFKASAEPKAKEFLAVTYYRLGDFTEAYDIFNKNNFSNDEARFYYGATCEKLNLFDQALDNYRNIKGKEFGQLASQRVNLIEKEANLVKINQISPEIYEIIAHSPGEKEYPQAGGLILLADEKIEVTADGKEIQEMHYIVKILNERGKETFAESQIDYDSTFEKVTLEYARTIKPDGTVADVGSRHIRDVSKYLNFPLYSNAHVYIISFPEVSEGAVIEYKVRVERTQLINKKDFISNYPVQSGEPIIAENFTLTLPKDKPLTIKILNAKFNDFGANLLAKAIEKDGRLVYQWQFKDVPQIIPEANMPPEVKINPTLVFSTFKSWQDIFDWWRDLAKDKIQADSAIKTKVKELVKDKLTDKQKIQSIYNFCAKEIRYVAVEYGQAGYEPHFAADTFKNKYGDCKDKAILLVTMLREAGLDAWPVLISTRDYYNLNPDFPTVLFNHCIAATRLEGKTVFMDSTASTCAFEDLPGDDQERTVLVFRPEKYSIENTPFFTADHNLNRQHMRIGIKPEEDIRVEKTIFTFGVYDQAQRYWLLHTPPELIKDALQEKIQDFAVGSTLSDYQIKNLDDLNLPVVLNYNFSGREYLTPAGTLRILPQLANIDTSLVAKDKRRYPVDFGILDSKETDIEIVLPGNFTVKYLPESILEDSPWLKFNVQYSRKGSSIVLQQKVDLKKNIITADEYPKFKIFFEGAAEKIKQRIILEKVK